MKTPFIKKFFNGIFGKTTESKKVAEQAHTAQPEPEHKPTAKGFSHRYIPKKEYHRPPVMETAIAAIHRDHRKVRNRMQKASRKITYGIA